MDAFAKGISFTVDRSDIFGTNFGAVLTLIIYTVVMVYA